MNFSNDGRVHAKYSSMKNDMKSDSAPKFGCVPYTRRGGQACAQELSPGGIENLSLTSPCPAGRSNSGSSDLNSDAVTAELRPPPPLPPPPPLSHCLQSVRVAKHFRDLFSSSFSCKVTITNALCVYLQDELISVCKGQEGRPVV